MAQKRVVSLYKKGKPEEVYTENMTAGEVDVLKLKIMERKTDIRIESLGATVEEE